MHPPTAAAETAARERVAGHAAQTRARRRQTRRTGRRARCMQDSLADGGADSAARTLAGSRSRAQCRLVVASAASCRQRDHTSRETISRSPVQLRLPLVKYEPVTQPRHAPVDAEHVEQVPEHAASKVNQMK